MSEAQVSQLTSRIHELEQLNSQLESQNASLNNTQATLKLLALGVETIDEGVLVLGTDFTVEYVNAAYLMIYHAEEDDLLGKKHPGIEAFRLDVGEEVFKSISMGVSWRGQRSETTFDGEELITEQSINPAYSDDGLTAYVQVVRDITEQAQMELSLQHSQKLESIGQLAAGIAHEINTPAQYVGDNMHFIKECWEDVQPLIKTGSQDQQNTEICENIDIEFIEEEVPTAFSQAISGIEQISHIVLAMKNFAHPGETVMEPKSLNEMIENVILIAKNEWKYIAEITTDLTDNLPLVNCIPSEVNQVLLNIVVNAAHAIEESGKEGMGTITLRSTHSPRGVKVIIEDTGVGMPEHVINRIFDPFFTTKGVGKGTGQGLSIAFRVMEKHNGTIDVSSVPGEGTTFTLRFPLIET